MASQPLTNCNLEEVTRLFVPELPIYNGLVALNFLGLLLGLNELMCQFRTGFPDTLLELCKVVVIILVINERPFLPLIPCLMLSKAEAMSLPNFLLRLKSCFPSRWPLSQGPAQLMFPLPLPCAAHYLYNC